MRKLLRKLIDWAIDQLLKDEDYTKWNDPEPSVAQYLYDPDDRR